MYFQCDFNFNLYNITILLKGLIYIMESDSNPSSIEE